MEYRDAVLQEALAEVGGNLTALQVPASPFFLAKCLPSWPPSPEIRTAHAKFTDFHVCVYRISA